MNAPSQEELNSIYTDDCKSLLSSVRRRIEVSDEKIEPGSLNVLSAKYEVLSIVKQFYYNLIFLLF